MEPNSSTGPVMVTSTIPPMEWTDIGQFVEVIGALSGKQITKFATLAAYKQAHPPDTDAKRMAWAVIEGDDKTAFVLADSILIDKARPVDTETMAEENAKLRQALSDIHEAYFDNPPHDEARAMLRIAQTALGYTT